MAKKIELADYSINISQVTEAFDKIEQRFNKLEENIKIPKSLFSEFEELTKKLSQLSKNQPGKDATSKQLEKYGKEISLLLDKSEDFQKKLGDFKINDKSLKSFTKETQKLGEEFKKQLSLQEEYKKKIAKNVKPVEEVGLQDKETAKFRNKVIEAAQKGTTGREQIKALAAERRAAAQKTLKYYESLPEGEYKTRQTTKGQSRVSNINTIERSALGFADQMELKIQDVNKVTNSLEQAKAAEIALAQQDLSGLTQEFTTANSAIQGTVNKLNDMTDAVQKQEERLSQFNSIKNYVTGFFSIGTVWQQTLRIIRGAFQDFLELDQQFNEIAVVSQYSTEEMWETFGQVNKTAQEYGVTTKNVVEVQNLYYHQGKNVNQVNKLTAQTLTLAKITGMDYARATSDLTAALNGYKMAAEDAAIVTDSISALDANAAISSEELMTALTKTASIAANAGMSLQSTEVFLTKMIETTREAPENLGTAMKTIVARFGEVKQEIDGEEVELADINKVDTALKSIGISLLDTAGQMRNLDDVFFELNAKWDSLDRNTQRYIATQAAGSRQQSRFIAMMEDYDRTLELVDIAQNSAGTGAKQLQKAQEGLESKINSLKSAWQELYSNVITSSMIGGLVSLGKDYIDILNQISHAWKPLGPIAGALSLWAIKVTVVDKGIKSLGKTFVSGSGLLEALSSTTDLHTKAIDAELVKMSNEDLLLTATNEKLKEQVRLRAQVIAGIKAETGALNEQQYSEMMDTVKSMKDAQKSETKDKKYWDVWKELFSKGKANGFSTGAEAAEGGTQTAGGLTQIFTNLKTTGLSIASVLGKIVAVLPEIITAAALIGSIVAIFYAYKKEALASLDDTKQVNKLSEAQENYNKTLQETNDLKKKAKEYEEYRINGERRTDLTTSQMEEEQSLAKELVETYPSLLNYIDSEGNYHLKNANAIQQEIEKKEKLVDLAQTNYLNLREKYAESGIYTDTSTLAGQAISNIQDFASIFGTEELNKNEDLKKIAKRIEEQAGSSFNKSAFYDIMEAYSKGEKSSFSYQDFQLFHEGGSMVGPEDWEKLLKEIENTGDEIVDESGKIQQEALAQAFAEAGIDNGTSGGAQTIAAQFVALNKELGGLYGQLLKGAATEQSSIYVEKAQMEVSEFDLQGSISEDLNSAISKAIVATAKSGYSEEEWINLGDKRSTIIENTSEQYRIATEKLNEAQLANLNKIVDEENLLSSTVPELTDLAETFNTKDMKEAVEEYWNQLPDETKQLMPEMDGIIANGSEEIIQIIFNAVKDGIESSNLEDGITGLINIYLENQKYFEKSDEFSDEATVTNFLNSLSGAQYKSLTSKLSSLEDDEKVPYLSALIQSYNQKSQGLSDSQKTQLKNTLVGTNLMDVSAVTKQQSTLKDLGYTTQEIGQLIVDTSNGVKNVIGTDADSIQDTVDSTVETLTSGLEGFTNLLSGNASTEQLNTFLTTMQSYYNQQDQLNGTQIASTQMMTLANSIVATSDGFQIASTEGNEYGQTLLDNAQAALALQISQLQAKFATEGLTEEERTQIATQIAYLKLVGSQMEASFKKAQNDGLVDKLSDAKDKADKLVTSLKNLVTWLREYDRYANLDRVIEDWENKKGHLEFEVDFSLNEQVLRNNVQKQINTINNEIAANQGGIKAAQEDAAMWRQVIQSRNSNYVSFDDSGNAIVNAQALRSLQEQIAAADEYHQESLQAQYDEIMDNVDAYQNARDKVEDYTSALEDNFTALQDLLNKAYDSIKTLEDKLIDVRQDQEDRELQAVKDKYDAIKEEDNKYLESVRKSIEKEREIRDRQDNEEDIRQKERKLAMMKMDTSGVYKNDIQSLEEELKSDYRSREDELIDSQIDEMEERFSAEQEERDKELTYWDNYYSELRDKRTEYNNWAQQVIQSGSDAVLDYLKANDQEYLSSSEVGKQIWTQQWQQATAAAVAYNGMISNTLNVVQMNLDMCAGSAGGFEGAVQSYSASAIAQNGQVSGTVQSLTGYYQGLAGGVGEVTSKVVSLQAAYNQAASAAAALASAQSRVFGGSFNPEDVNGAGNPHLGEPTTDKNSQRPASEINEKDTGWVGDSDRYSYVGEQEQNGIKYYEYLYTNKDGEQEYIYFKKDVLDRKWLQSDTQRVTKQASGTFYRLKNRSGRKYASGGYVDYTGPAWVDGTKSKPEYMLNSTQTAQFEKLVNILDSIFVKTPSYSSSNLTPQNSSQEAIFNFNIDVQKMSSDYDVDQVINRIQKKLSSIDKYKKVTFLKKTN